MIKLNFSVLIVLLYLINGHSAYAQSYGIAKMTEKFADQTGDTVNSYAKNMGITTTEAQRRLVLMNKAGILAKKLDTRKNSGGFGALMIH